MKVGDNVRLLDDGKFNWQHIGKIFTVTLNAGDVFELTDSDGYTQYYYPSWGTDCYEIVNEPTSEVTKIVTTPTEESPTGSLRFNTGKPQSNEISPKFLLDMGAVLEKSRQKYPRGNWAKGNNYSVPFDSMMRHILAWQSGETIDSESGQSHLAHAALNLMMLHYYEENFPEFDDRIFKKEKK